ncbi:MAG TPA: hypothetical protein VIN08_16530 [Ohtaekwangia sp.]|uniref:hypothetical protein n=1 Tax=Ohtaekwangia sp. TaxID=2066019 RepID=UPI002F94EAEE
MITRIYTTPQVVIDYDASVPCLVATSFDFMMPAEFRAHLNFALDFMCEKIKETGKTMMWLPDTSASPVFDEESTKWSVEDWTPRAVAAGIRHIGFVLPENELAQIALDDYKEGGVQAGMRVGFFKDVASAKQWFRELMS